MAALMQKTLRLSGRGRIAALFTGCLLFSLSGRSGGKLTFEQHILSAVSDHYYLTWFLLPLVLLICFSYVADDGKMVTVRFGSYFSYFCNKWAGAGLLALLVILVQTAGILLSGAGLSMGNTWIQNTELNAVLKQYFSSPLSAFGAYTVFQFAGIWMINGLCMWICHFAGRRWSAGIFMLLYILAAFWLKLPALQGYPVTGLNHFLILHHNLTGANRFAATALTALLLIIIILFSVRALWRFEFAAALPGRGLLPYYMRELVSPGNLIALCAVIIGFTIYKGLKSPFMKTGMEWINSLFAGHGVGYFQIIPFLELMIVNGTALYLLAVFIEKAIKGQTAYTAVRVAGRRELLLTLLTAGALFLSLYCLIWLAAGCIGSSLWGLSFEKVTAAYLLCSVALKFLDLLLQFMAMLLVYVCTKQITAGFLALLAGNLLCVAPAAVAAYLPFGLSSMARLSLSGAGLTVSVYPAFGILLGAALLILLWHLKYGFKKLF